jgi:predicted phage-related endonuclease
MAKADHLPNLVREPFPDASATKPTSRGQPAAHENKEAGRGHRRHFIGGSDARIIMGEDEAALLRLWREKRGEVEPEDFSGNLLVQLGKVTEELNRRWYEANSGQVIVDIQKRIWHPTLHWMAATLDGRVESSGAVFEAKFMLPWSFAEGAAVVKHAPQQ